MSLTERQQIAQDLADLRYRVATSADNTIAYYQNPIYAAVTYAFRAVVADAYPQAVAAHTLDRIEELWVDCGESLAYVVNYLDREAAEHAAATAYRCPRSGCEFEIMVGEFEGSALTVEIFDHCRDHDMAAWRAILADATSPALAALVKRAADYADLQHGKDRRGDGGRLGIWYITALSVYADIAPHARDCAPPDADALVTPPNYCVACEVAFDTPGQLTQHLTHSTDHKRRTGTLDLPAGLVEALAEVDETRADLAAALGDMDNHS